MRNLTDTGTFLRALLLVTFGALLPGAVADGNPQNINDLNSNDHEKSQQESVPDQRLGFDDDFWETGTLSRLDDDGRLVYVVKTRLVPGKLVTERGNVNWIDPYTLDPNAFYLSNPRQLRSGRSAVIAGTPRATTGSTSATTAAPRSVRPRSGPAARTAPSSRRATPNTPRRIDR